MDELIGRSFGPYVVVERIGEGGMAVVYKGFQESLNRYVAIKVLREELARDQQFIARFRREALSAAKLVHPNLLHVYDTGMDQGVYYIVMDYAPGGTLKDLLRRGPMDPERAASIAAQVADALDYAHRQGFVHRDVKPGNILFSADGRPQLTDFGIAKALYEATRLTQAGSSIGTPDYMAPEQIQGQPVDGRTDLYALGIVLYEMLSGRTPFRGSTPVSVLYKQINDAPPSLRSLSVHAPAWLEAVLEKAIAKRPQDRFQLGSEFAEALRRHYVPGAVRESPAMRRSTPPPLKPSPVPTLARPSVPSGTFRPAGRPRSRRLVPILVAVILVVVLALIGVGVALVLGGLDQQQGSGKVPAVVTMVVTSQVVTQVVTPVPATPTELPPATNTPVLPPAQPSAPTWTIPSLQATVTDLLLFESGYSMPAHDERQYATRFASSETHYINYELDLEFPAPGQPLDFQVEAVYYGPDGTELTRFTDTYHLEPDWTTSWQSRGWGWDDPGKWSVGTCRVDLYVEDQVIASIEFEIY
jgi:serine/threonine protein kinase